MDKGRRHDLDSVRSRHRVDRVMKGPEKPSWTRWLATAFLGLALLALVGLMIANAVTG